MNYSIGSFGLPHVAKMKELDTARCLLVKHSKEAPPEGKQDYWDSAGVVFKFVRRLNIASSEIMTRFRDYYVPFISSNCSNPLHIRWSNNGKTTQ